MEDSKLQSAVRVHHPFSPSTLQAREACPKYSPAQSDNEASVMGTLQHDAVDSGMDDDRIPDYRAAAVAECMRFVDERMKLYPGGQLLKEQYLPIDEEKIRVYVSRPTPTGSVTESMEFEGTTAGYVDVAIVSADETKGELLDWKFGRNAVTHAKDNLQGIAYMLGLKRKFPKLKECTIFFIQPHIDHVTTHTFDLSNPDSYLLRIRTVVRRAMRAQSEESDFSTARPTIGTCLFCNLVGSCPKVAELVIQVGRKFAPLVVPESVNTTTLRDPAQVSMGLKLAQVVQVWAEAYRAQATAKSLESDTFVPEGYVLVPSQKLGITNAKGVGETAKKFLPPEDADKVEALYDISLTPLDKLISLRAERGSKDKTVEKFRMTIVAEGHAKLGKQFAYLRMAPDTTEKI